MRLGLISIVNSTIYVTPKGNVYSFLERSPYLMIWPNVRVDPIPGMREQRIGLSHIRVVRGIIDLIGVQDIHARD